jgi:hypothetical protein
MTLQKHKVDNMSETDAHMVMSWLTDAIESLEDEQDIQKIDTSIPSNEEATTIAQSTVADAANGGLIPPSPDVTQPVGQTASSQSQLPIQASADAEKTKSKTNLPPELGRREKGETVAMPFLRRKALKDPKADDFKKADTEAARLHAWAVVDRAAGLLSDEIVSDSYIRKSFNIAEDLPIDQITRGTLLRRLLVDPERPSADWWDSCTDFAKTIEGVTEPGAFAASLYYSPTDFKIMDFIEKEEISSSGENIKVHTYDTKNFDICPGAVNAFEVVLESSCSDAEGLIVKAAKETDRFLGMEKKFLDKGNINTNEVEEMVSSIASTHYMVGQLSEQLCQDFTNEFTFTAMHVANVLPLVDKGMDLENLEKSHHEVEKVDDLIYTEDVDEDDIEDIEEDTEENLEEDTKDIEKGIEHRKDLEAPSETGPMARAAKRPNVIMREEFTTDEETEYKRQPDTSGAGPAGDSAEPANVSADAIDGLGLSADGKTGVT